MERGQLAARQEIAINKIMEISEINLSRQNLPKANTTELLQLFQLEALARELQPPVKDRDMVSIALVLEVVAGTKGVGESLYNRIVKAIDEARD